MPDEWERLAEVFRSRRIDLRMSQARLAQLSNTSESTIRLIEKAGRDAYHPVTLRAVAQALGYTPDSPERVLRGEEPEEATQAALRPPSHDQDDAIAAISRRLAAVELVVGLPPGDIPYPADAQPAAATRVDRIGERIAEVEAMVRGEVPGRRLTREQADVVIDFLRAQAEDQPDVAKPAG